jgi:hypothetical protein
VHSTHLQRGCRRREGRGKGNGGASDSGFEVAGALTAPLVHAGDPTRLIFCLETDTGSRATGNEPAEDGCLPARDSFLRLPVSLYIERLRRNVQWL